MKSKIKETKFHKTDTKGSSCLVVMEDKTDGFFNYKGEFPFAVGEDVEYEATKTEKKSKPGEFYNMLTISHVTAMGSPPAAPPKPQSNNCGCGTSDITAMKFEARMKCLELAHNAFISGKLDDKEAKEHFVAWVAAADGLINELSR